MLFLLIREPCHCDTYQNISMKFLNIFGKVFLFDINSHDLIYRIIYLLQVCTKFGSDAFNALISKTYKFCEK